MPSTKTAIFGAAMAATLVLQAGHAFAGETVDNVPAPGIIGLVALGVVGAIAIARSRK